MQCFGKSSTEYSRELEHYVQSGDQWRLESTVSSVSCELCTVGRILILDQDQSRCIVLLTVDKIGKFSPKLEKIEKKSESSHHNSWVE